MATLTGAPEHLDQAAPNCWGTPTVPRDLSQWPEPVLQVSGLSARAPDGTLILDDVTFSLERGWLVAIVGPTGAGKTSLARALTGSLALEAGTIRIDGHDLATSSEEARRRIGHVPQEDLLQAQLGLGRMLEYAAALRLPSSINAQARSRRVSAVLAELGLERQAGVAVRSLSGGQRKRANIAMELLAQPDILVLDEPTSGLDPGYERSVMATLAQLAARGRTVVAVTHSMQALAACDRVLFLAARGQVAFFGTPAEAIAYFEGADAADLFQALDDPGSQSWKDRFRSHTDHARYVGASPRSARSGAASSGLSRSDLDRQPGARTTPWASPALPGWGSQLRVLVARYVSLIRSDHRHMTMLALQGPVLGLLLWAVLAPHSLVPAMAGVDLTMTAPRAVTVTVFLTISATWLGTANAVREIVKERAILARERSAGLSLNAYVASKAVVLGSLILVQGCLLTAIACARQLPPAHGAVISWGLGELMVTTALTGLAAVGLGLLVSALVKTPDKAMTVLPLVLVAELVLSGAWGSVTSIPGMSQLSDLTGAHWGVKAIEATLTGDSRAWWSAIVALALLTWSTLVATAFLVHRRLQPARTAHPVAARAAHPLAARAARPVEATPPAGLLARHGTILAPLVAGSFLVLAAGMTAAGLGMAQPGSAPAMSAAAEHRPGATASSATGAGRRPTRKGPGTPSVHPGPAPVTRASAPASSPQALAAGAGLPAPSSSAAAGFPARSSSTTAGATGASITSSTAPTSVAPAWPVPATPTQGAPVVGGATAASVAGAARSAATTAASAVAPVANLQPSVTAAASTSGSTPASSTSNPTTATATTARPSPGAAAVMAWEKWLTQIAAAQAAVAKAGGTLAGGTFAGTAPGAGASAGAHAGGTTTSP